MAMRENPCIPGFEKPGLKVDLEHGVHLVYWQVVLYTNQSFHNRDVEITANDGCVTICTNQIPVSIRCAIFQGDSIRTNPGNLGIDNDRNFGSFQPVTLPFAQIFPV